MRPPGFQRRGEGARSALIALLLAFLVGAIAWLAVNASKGSGNSSATNGSGPTGETATAKNTLRDDSDGGNQTPGERELTEQTAVSSYSFTPELREILDYINQERFMEARALLALYMKGKPESAPREFMHGLTYHKEKRYEQARPFFERAVTLDPGYRPGWYFYAWCLYYLGDLAKSRECFERHLGMDPLEGDSHFGLALIDMDEGDLDAAEANLLKAIQLQQNNPRRMREVAKAHARLGDVYATRDQLEEAKRELFLATELWPDHYEAHFKLARVLTRLGDDAGAAESMRNFESIRSRMDPSFLPTSPQAPEEANPTSTEATDETSEPNSSGAVPQSEAANEAAP